MMTSRIVIPDYVQFARSRKDRTDRCGRNARLLGWEGLLGWEDSQAPTTPPDPYLARSHTTSRAPLSGAWHSAKSHDAGSYRRFPIL